MPTQLRLLIENARVWSEREGRRSHPLSGGGSGARVRSGGQRGPRAKHAKPLSMDAERTCQPVARHVEDSQIDKVAKLLGEAAYRKKCDYQHKITRSDRIRPIGAPSRRLPSRRSSFKCTSFPRSFGTEPGDRSGGRSDIRKMHVLRGKDLKT